MTKRCASLRRGAGFLLLMLCCGHVHAEALLQLFNTSWTEITRKMPELAEAGYTSMWLPPPTKGSGGLSVGYDLWDPFDLGSKDQRGSVRTRYGTEAELLQLVEVAHRFGIRVYFDTIVNHRAFDVPGYDENTPINIYPGMVPEDFHLRVTADGFYRKWDNTRDWGSQWQVQNLGLADLIDIAQETPNANFGTTEGSTHAKYSFVRHPDHPEYYCTNSSGTYVGFGNVTAADMAANPDAFKEDVGAYLIRNVRWLIDRTKADGLRLDAVKHVPDYFFGQQSGAGKDSSTAGFVGGAQLQFHITRGFSDTNLRDSVFDTELPRNDAMVFGEHLGSPPAYNGYWDAGMRLVDNDLRSKLNGVLGNPSATLYGLDSPGGGGFSPSLGVMHATSHDNDYAAQRQLQHAMYYTREGLGLIYSDGNYHADVLGESGGAFPRHANTAFLGQWGDPRIPNLAKINGDFARGYQAGLWGDSDYLAYERRDNRNPDGTTTVRTAANDVTMVVMLNDNTAAGQSRGISTSFPAGAYLYQYATGPNGSNQTGFYKFGSELSSVIVPPGGYFIFSYRTPELSTLWPSSAITLYQNGTEVPRITVTRQDGPDGDSTFNPSGLANNGYPSGVTPTPYTYQTTIPVVKSGSALDIVARADGSAENILLKLDGGVDLNGTGYNFTINGASVPDAAKRDRPPGVFNDTYLGYEQPIFRDRQFPEKFAAVDTSRCQIGSPGAETYSKVIGGGVTINNGPASANNYSTESGNQPSWIYHDPAVTVGGPSGGNGVGGLQYIEGASTITIWAKSNSVGSGFKMFVYYTTDGTYPEGAGGMGRGTTQVAAMGFDHNQSPDDWWSSVSITKPAAGSVFRYKIGAYKNGPGIQPSWWPADAASVAFKKKMLTTFSVTGFDPSTVQYHLHNDYNSLTTGLKEGYHVLRARAFLPTGKGGRAFGAAPLYQTFTQTFYYDAATPEANLTFPTSNGDTVGGNSYEMVIRTDSTVNEVWVHIDDSDSNNDDNVTKSPNGNGAGGEPFLDANKNGVYNAGETFTDLNGNGVYDATLTAGAWAQATRVTPSLAINSSLPVEWRFTYKNIPATGSATIKIRAIEASSSRDPSLDAATAHVTEINRTVTTSGPLERANIAWPQSDGDVVDDSYVMKVYLSAALADGLTAEQIKSRMIFTIASTADGANTNPVAQNLSNATMNWGSFGPGGLYRELSIPLPNLYNGDPNFRHYLSISYTKPDGSKASDFRLVRAAPSTKPFVTITQPSEVDSDGKKTVIVLPDGPGTDLLYYHVLVQTSATVTSVALAGDPAITVLNETYTDSNANGKFDAQEPYTDTNGNGHYDLGEPFTDLNANGIWDANEQPSLVDTNGNGTWDGITCVTNGTTKTWDIPWMITAAGNYRLTATATVNGGPNATNSRSANVILREVVPVSSTSTDSDDDGILDTDEITPKALPTTNSDTWTNGDVHAYNAFGKTSPTMPDTDGDGLPDALEVGWRTASNPPTNPTTDTNGDGYPNFIGDLDPPFYATTDNVGKVPGVGSLSAGDNRSRQAAGSTTDPTNPDTDGDGIKDGVEDANRNGWVDGDGESIQTTWDPWLARKWPNHKIDAGETWQETDPNVPDSDGDGLLDGYGEDKNGNGRVDMQLKAADGTLTDFNIQDPANAAYRNGGIRSRSINYSALLAAYKPDGTGLAQTNGFPKLLWQETDPLNADTDGDGLPDGWEVQHGLDPLDDGQWNWRTGEAGNPNNGAAGDPDSDGKTNLQEYLAGTDPQHNDTNVGGGGEGPIQIGRFTDWTQDDLIALDPYNENGSQAADVYRTNTYDSSRDIVAFSFHDGGADDGKVYFRVDFMDLQPNAEQGEVDAYVVINTGNIGAGEAVLPDEVDITSTMKWQAVAAIYGQNSGTLYLDTNPLSNSTTEGQKPSDFGVTGIGVGSGGIIAAAWSSKYDALEFSVSRTALQAAGWNGDPNKLNFQVFTTRDGTWNSPTAGPGDIAGRNDIRDIIGDDWLASDYWKDQDNIRLNGKMTSYFGRSSTNDRGKCAKVMLLAHGNQAIQPASIIQNLVNDKAASGAAGYFRMLQTHEAYNAPLTLHVTPTLASALQWAKNPNPGTWPNNDGPTFNARLTSLVGSGKAELLGSTFADHIPKYFPQSFNNSDEIIADKFLDAIYGNGSPAVSRAAFWAPERVLDDRTLGIISGMGYSYTFADQMRHFVKWFGRTSALGADGYRINQVNGVKIFPIHDVTSAYLEQTLDEGSSLSLRQLLSRRARSDIQDQVVVLWRDMSDFADNAKASAYDANVRWLASRPWVRVVTPDQIMNGQVPYKGQDGNTYTSWGTKDRGTGQSLAQTAKDWVDHATQENYNNWYFGSPNETSLFSSNFGAATPFGQVGVSGHSNSAWSSLSNTAFSSGLGDLSKSVIHAAMFETAFHNTTNNDLTKFSTGDYLNPDTGTGQTLTDFARYAQSQARFAAIYARVQQWASSATSTTLGTEASDVDLDGAAEYLLFNSRVFALFEAKGGRMTAAWMRDPTSGKVWQVAGNFSSYSGTDTEDEGASNFVGATTALSAYRTSGFKDWWTVDASNNGSNAGVNAIYNVTAASSGTGWTFSTAGVSKTIRLSNAFSERLEATYQLSGLAKAYVRFGLSPNLLDLMTRGQAGLAEANPTRTRVNLTNTGPTDTVRAWVEGPQINSAATDVAATGFSTVLRRNQAQTSQVEVELTGAGPHILTLGFDLGTDLTNPDTDSDGLPDAWEIANFGNLNATASGDADGDGLTNLQEYIFGSDPNNASSGYPLTSVAPTSGGFNFSFPTIAGRNYQPQVSTNLSTWSALGSSVAGDGTTKSATDFTTGPRRFYRLIISLP